MIILLLSGCAKNQNPNYDPEIMAEAEIQQVEFIDIAIILLMTIGGILLFLSVLLIGFKMIFQSRNPKAREESMSAITYILIGTIILGTIVLTSGLVMSFMNNIQPDLIASMEIEATAEEGPLYDYTARMVDKGNFLTSAITALLTVVIGFFKFIQQFVFGDSFEGVISMIFKETSYAHAPFTNQEWGFLNQLYLATSSIMGVFVLLMVGKTGISYIMYSHSPQKRERLSDDIQRWILMGIMLAFAPILIEALTKLFNAIILMLYSSFAKGDIISNLAGENMIKNIETSSTFTTRIAQALFMYTEIRIIIIFYVRKVVLTIMYAFTPIAIGIWGLNNRSYASAVWFGEMITNLSMGLFYSFSFFVMIGTLRSSDSLSNWLLVIIWMMSIIPITKVLRNSLQGLFIMMAGVDEEALAGSALGVTGTFLGTSGAMLAGMGAAVATTFKGRNPRDPLNIFNKGTDPSGPSSPSGGGGGGGETVDNRLRMPLSSSNATFSPVQTKEAATSGIGESTPREMPQYNYDKYMDDISNIGKPLSKSYGKNDYLNAWDEIGDKSNILSKSKKGTSNDPISYSYDDYLSDMDNGIMVSKAYNKADEIDNYLDDIGNIGGIHGDDPYNYLDDMDSGIMVKPIDNELSKYKSYDDYLNSMRNASMSASLQNIAVPDLIPKRNPYSEKLINNYQAIKTGDTNKRYNNVKDMIGMGARIGGAFASNATKMVFGHDPAFGYAINNVTSLGKNMGQMGKNVDTFINVGMAGKAIHETVDDIKTQEPGIKFQEAINKIFDQDPEDPFRMERIRVIGDLMNTKQGVVPPKGKIIYNTSSYTNIDNMNFKN